MIKSLLMGFQLCLMFHAVTAQKITQIKGLPSFSFRAVDMHSEQEWWVSGQKNTVAKTSDGGLSWQTFVVGDTAHHMDFRDVDVLLDGSVLVMGITKPACIYKSSDKGITWRLVFQDSTLFLDGFDFWDSKNGICLGDPINSFWTLLTTRDGGESWQKVKNQATPEAQEKEAAFAAGGAPIKVFGKKEVGFVTGGGEYSRLVFSTNRGKSWDYRFPLVQSGPSAGLFSLEKSSKGNLIVIGGDYQQPNDSSSNIAFIQNDKYDNITVLADNIPRGYRCSIANVNSNTMIVVGDEGVDVSIDGGFTWQPINSPGYYAVSCKSNTCVMVGKNGKVAKIEFSPLN